MTHICSGVGETKVFDTLCAGTDSRQVWQRDMLKPYGFARAHGRCGAALRFIPGLSARRTGARPMRTGVGRVRV